MEASLISKDSFQIHRPFHSFSHVLYVNLQLDVSSTSADFFLCNEGGLDVVFNVIGDIELESEPVKELTQTVISAVTTEEINSQTVAFLGTDNGRLLKVKITSSFKCTDYIADSYCPGKNIVHVIKVSGLFKKCYVRV